MFKTILLSIDGSTYTDAIIDAGIFLAKKLNCHLKVLSVIDVRPQDWQASVGSESIVPIIPALAPPDDNQEQQSSRIHTTIVEVEKKLSDNGVDFTVETITGLPVESICDHARVADMVIMGIRGNIIFGIQI